LANRFKKCGPSTAPAATGAVDNPKKWMDDPTDAIGEHRDRDWY
jgi:hypothetical protein